jgi:RecA-family ATPase
MNDDGWRVVGTPLPWIDMSNWDHEPVPAREWAIKDRVPLRQAGLFSGEGGTGKSIIELTKNVAHVAARDWLGSMPEPGPAFYVGAEDEKDEIHRRLAAITAHYGLTFKEVIDGGLMVMSLLGQDAVLCAVTGKSGKVEVTGMYRQLLEAAGDIKPKNISIDPLSRAFAGNEIDRVQVYAFAQHMQALAMIANGAVTVLSHPSLAGMASGSGLSGSTAWHGAFRFRTYLSGIKADKDDEPDNDLRELQFKKNQYGPLGETLVLRWRSGLFLPDRSGSTLDALAREQQIDNAFLHAMGRLLNQGFDLSPHPTAHNYMLTKLADQPEIKALRVRSGESREAFGRLLMADRIHIATEGPPSKQRKRVLLGGKPSSPDWNEGGRLPAFQPVPGWRGYKGGSEHP